MSLNKHIQPAFTMNSSSIIESTKGLVSFYEPLASLVEHSDPWSRLQQYCDYLAQYPSVMNALARLHANSMIDFERGLFCGLISMLAAEKLDMDPVRIRALYVAGLTQDVGSYMDDYRIADHFAGADQTISQRVFGVRQDRLNRSHALVSYSLLEEAMSDDVLVAELVLHHHATEDGTGFPSNIAEEQLSEEKQVLIVANTICEILHDRGGYDALFSCRSELKLASTMFFKRVNGAFYEILHGAASRLGTELPVSINLHRLQLQTDALRRFSEKAVLLNADLIEFEHYNAVRLLRARIKRIDLLMNESGLLVSIDDGCVNEAVLCMEALPAFLHPMLELLKETLRVLPRDYRGDAADVKVTLKELLNVLQKPKPFSLFS